MHLTILKARQTFRLSCWCRNFVLVMGLAITSTHEKTGISTSSISLLSFTVSQTTTIIVLIVYIVPFIISKPQKENYNYPLKHSQTVNHFNIIDVENPEASILLNIGI